MSRCECKNEDAQQSAHSPGVVGDAEGIVYALVDPLTSSVKQISKSQLKSSEVSVCRADHCSASEAREAIVETLLQKDSSRSDNGFLYAFCHEIRGIKLGATDVGAFCVIDDGLENYKAHAHLGYSSPTDEKLRNHREAARGNLLILLNRRGVTSDWAGEPFLQTELAAAQ